MHKSVLAVSLLCSSLVVGGATQVSAHASPSPAHAPAVVATVARAAASSSDLRVGSYNILNVSLDRTRGEQRPWKQRRGRVIRQILNQHLDVVGIQEANPAAYFRRHLVGGRTQYLDLRNGLNRSGGHYSVTNPYGYDCANPWTTYHCRHVNRKASNATRILFNNRTLSMVSQGSYRFAHQGGSNSQYVAYAVLRARATGKSFLFTSVHLTPGSADLRRAQIDELISLIDRIKGDRPVISVGDFNTQKFDPVAAHLLPAMKSAGFGDTANQQYATNPLTRKRAWSMSRGWINSYNHFRRNVASFGYASRRDKIGNGIDWIFASNQLSVKQWKVVVLMNPRTLRLRGVLPSDHNMVRAVISLR